MFTKKTANSDKVGTSLINKQNHEDLLQSIQELSSKTQKHKPLVTVKEKGSFFGLGTHKVTGKEFNRTVSQINDELIHSNEFDTAVLNHLNAIYKAIDALDADHISGIMSAADVAKAADDKANVNSQNIEKVITLLTNNSNYIAEKNEIKKSIETMEKKVKTAYYVAAGSIGLAIITLLLSVCGVF